MSGLLRGVAVACDPSAPRTMSALSPTPSKLVLVMVGLPARGKSYIARKLARYLRWRGHETRVFNVGSYRRELVGSQKSHEVCDPDNDEGARC
jgi:adenylylsulfate kinase-like enzyme